MPYDPHNAFAKILTGELPCVPVYEDEHTLAFMDIMPQADGHVLVIPKEPASMIFGLSEDAAVACIKTARRIAIAVKRAVGAEGIVIAQLNGEAAGQTVPHVHFHVIPRHHGTAQRPHAAIRADPVKLQQLADLIVAALRD